MTFPSTSPVVHSAEHFAMGLEIAMGHVEAKYVDASGDQCG